MALGAFLGQSYIARLSLHTGYFLVPVSDAVASGASLRTKPRRTVFIIVDGLRRDAAESMAVTRALAERGQCRISNQGSWTVSRPVYALLSTGVEADRTGARNNEETSPLAAESIWQVARAHGLRVLGSSHLPWLRELFPDGFDRFRTAASHAEDVFDVPELLDVNVFHPLYVDEAGHRAGAASADYAAAVARADREIAGLLARVDLAEDLVVLTADHGHRAEGGHGGAQPEIADVLLCAAGPNVLHAEGRARLDGRDTAPALALLLGLPFPRHMRASEDDLDALWSLTRILETDAAYAGDRLAAIERFRAANRAFLRERLGDGQGSWPRFYAREARAQLARALLIAALAAGLLFLRLRRTPRREALWSLAFLALLAVVTWGVHRAVLGELDFTVINLKSRFVPRALAIVLIATALAGILHAVVIRDRARLANDALTAVALLALVNLGHVFVYGWPLGFPLPSAAMRYFPFFGAIALAANALLTIAVLFVAERRAVPLRRARSRS